MAVLKAFGVAAVSRAVPIRATLAVSLALLAALCLPVAGNAAMFTPWSAPSSGLSGPSGVALDSSGNLYVADTANDRIRKFDRLGRPLAGWGSTGSGPGQFRAPRGVAVDSSGTIYVADTGNDRVQRLFSNGGYDTEWGGPGSADGRFDGPVAIATDSGDRIWVADRGNDRISRFNSWGSLQCQISGAGEGEGGHPCGSAAGGPGVGSFRAPAGVAVRGSRVFISDSGGDRILGYGTDGKFETAWGGTGSAVGEFTGPAGVAVDSAGSVFIADSGNDRVQKFTRFGRFEAVWGGFGAAGGQFSNPLGLAVGPADAVYVADTGNDRIQSLGGASATDPRPDPGPDPERPGIPEGPVVNPPPKKSGHGKSGQKKARKKARKKAGREAEIRRVRVWKEGGGTRLKAGSVVNLKVAVKNSGNLRTGFLRVWLGKQPIGRHGRARIQIKRQFPVSTILPGWTVTGTVTIKVGRKARGRVALTAQAWGTTGKKKFRIVR